ncbi:cysteine desulfurase [Stieleria sp. TO1_6]|uniref:cysteine desulfurase family protein n=1 Tax=Stieleria tagensis TaxID=2956795 RepID=UPI00209A9E41|nr:cysteine desulfurase family protein [Stieleria tagensis]MCO8123535.1 cysteine desulfurase [Stieleria tagensis]
MNPEIYLDNNATTHLSGAVGEAVKTAVEENFGNPSSEHRSGEKARRTIVESRDAIASLLGVSADRLLFGSGATELNYWVLSDVVRSRGNAHLVTTQVEHSCVLETANALEANGVRVTRLPVDRKGRIDLEQLVQSMDNETSLVSVQWVNNETGVIQPIREIADVCDSFGVPFHCDAAQAIGKVEVDFDRIGIDFLTTSAHKMHGPTGIGALCVKDRRSLGPMLRGGSQEHGLRPGTENLLGIIGFGAAASEREGSLSYVISSIAKLRDHFEAMISESLPRVVINGRTEHRVCNSTNLMFPGLDGAAIVALLDRNGVRCSQSSACTSSRPEPSYVLRAMGLSEEEAFASVRFSFSNQNTMAEVERAASKLISTVGRLSGFAPRQTETDNLQGAFKHEV